MRGARVGLMAAVLLTPAVLLAEIVTVGPEVQVNQQAVGFQGDPDVAADVDGFVVVWRDSDGGRVAGRQFDAIGTPTGPELTVDDLDGDDAYAADPSVAATGGGSFLTVVQRSICCSAGSAAGVFLRRWDAAAMPIGDAVRANTQRDGSHGRPDVAVDGGGNFIVVWDSYYGEGPDQSARAVFGRRYDALGQPLGSEFQVNEYEEGNQGRAVVAATPGGFVVAWESSPYAGPYGPSHPSQDGEGAGIFARRYDASGDALGGEFRVNTHTDGNQTGPSISAAPDGGVVVGWSSWDRGGPAEKTGVFFQSFLSDGSPAAPETRVTDDTAGWQDHASVAVEPGGGFVVAWRGEAHDLGEDDVFARHFTRVGTPLGEQVRVNEWTAGPQFSTTVAVSPAGDFVVGWQSGSHYENEFGPDGDDSSISLRRLVVPAPMVPISGKRLVLRAEKLRFESRDAALADVGDGEGDADPRAVGGHVRLFGDTFDVTHELPANGWRRLPDEHGWEYRSEGEAGPLRRLRIRFGTVLRVKARGTGLGYDLTSDPGAVEAMVSVGAKGPRWCARFGGTRTFRGGKVLKASGAPAPASCS